MNDLPREPSTAVIAGIAGIVVLVVTALAMAVWDGARFYRTEHIQSSVEQVMQEQLDRE